MLTLEQDQRKAALYNEPFNTGQWYKLENGALAVLCNSRETNQWKVFLIKNKKVTQESEWLLTYENAIEWIVVNE